VIVVVVVCRFLALAGSSAWIAESCVCVCVCVCVCGCVWMCVDVWMCGCRCRWDFDYASFRALSCWMMSRIHVIRVLYVRIAESSHVVCKSVLQ
jgi:hypothetical protein